MAPELSIVILSYNQFDLTTGPCLASFARIEGRDLEIILVDNGSDELTLQGLGAAAARDSRIKLVLNPENRGFAGGNNDGVARARGEKIILLNSDTRILPESLSLLNRQLESTMGPAMIGPVTNAAGNEQQIYCWPGDAQSILAQGVQWSNQARGSLFATDQLSFFCVAMFRETYRQLGGLDESFGLGYYEDADFCCRAAKAGIRLLVMEESFVYHAGSASFATMSATRKKLLRENGKRFRDVHGRPPQQHVRDKNLDLLRGYLAEAAEKGWSPALASRFDNRVLRARQLGPRSPLKKILYGYRLRRILRAAGMTTLHVRA